VQKVEFYLSGVVKTDADPEKWMEEFKEWLKGRGEMFDGEVIDINREDDSLKEIEEILKGIDVPKEVIDDEIS